MQIPKVQKESQFKQFFALSGSTHVKAACKHVDEIDPWFSHLDCETLSFIFRTSRRRCCWSSLIYFFLSQIGSQLTKRPFHIFKLQVEQSFTSQFRVSTMTQISFFYISFILTFLMAQSILTSIKKISRLWFKYRCDMSDSYFAKIWSHPVTCLFSFS